MRDPETGQDGDASYGRLKRLIAAIFVAYFCIGIAAEQYHYVSGTVQPPRIYPFYMWSMFARIPNASVTYTVEIEAFDGTVFDPPLPLQDSGPLLLRLFRVTDFTKRTAIELGLALESGDSAAIATTRRKFEMLFGDKPFRYDVVRVTKDPIRYWREHEYDEMEVLATFERL